MQTVAARNASTDPYGNVHAIALHTLLEEALADATALIRGCLDAAGLLWAGVVAPTGIGRARLIILAVGTRLPLLLLPLGVAAIELLAWSGLHLIGHGLTLTGNAGARLNLGPRFGAALRRDALSFHAARSGCGPSGELPSRCSCRGWC